MFVETIMVGFIYAFTFTHVNIFILQHFRLVEIFRIKRNLVGVISDPMNLHRHNP